MELSDLLPPRDLPARDAWIPALAVRGLLLACGLGLALGVERGAAWIVVAGLLALGAALAPEALLAWALIAVLGIGLLSRPAAVGWRDLVLVAGVHLLHLLGLFSRELPWRAWIQPAVFLAPLRRFLAIQIPCQLVALGVLELFVAGHHRPGHLVALAALGALALAGLAVVLLGAGAQER